MSPACIWLHDRSELIIVVQWWVSVALFQPADWQETAIRVKDAPLSMLSETTGDFSTICY